MRSYNVSSELLLSVFFVLLSNYGREQSETSLSIQVSGTWCVYTWKHDLKTGTQINSFTFSPFGTQCREISWNLTCFLTPRPHAFSCLFFFSPKDWKSEPCEKTVEPQFVCQPHQTIGSFTHFVGGAMQSAQTKEGQDKLRESAESLYQQKDECCLWRTHHHIWCRQHRSEMCRKVCICACLQTSTLPPNNWFWSPPQHCLVVASREIKQER